MRSMLMMSGIEIRPSVRAVLAFSLVVFGI
jgi:hypothetical protein